MTDIDFLADLEGTVTRALAEDIGPGDITAELIAADTQASATVVCRDNAVICGRPWVDEVFRQVDDHIRIDWHLKEGQRCERHARVFTVQGPARGLLTAERSALNFLQTLSGTATIARDYAELVADTDLRILDTRKTIPGLRLAQKYAVTTGGCHNHRIGLFDAFLIKENHISACGSISEAVKAAQALYPNRPVEVEAETLEQLDEALAAGCDLIMLDNFSLAALKEAVRRTDGRARLEASGGYNEKGIIAVAETGVDYVSVGALTKHCQAVDFSMRLSMD